MIHQSACLVVILLLSFSNAFPDAVKTGRNAIQPIVTTPMGQIQGGIIQSRLGKQIFSFRGIRYAKAPVNELRFQPPVPAEKWEGVYNATDDGPVCPQPTTDAVSEDCLMLNVFTTKLPKGDEKIKRPVVVYFHPGGFYSTGGPTYWGGPNYFLDQNIVLVTLNYRLGSLGFLSTGDKEATGNNGLKDQVLALKWVKQNIEAFGGDQDSVTIMGYSAGAISVILHMVSPMSQGLFHRAISMSGSILGNFVPPHNQLEIAKRQARFLGCPDDTSANIVKCLRSKSAAEMGDTLPKFAEFGLDPVLIWSPVIEDDFGHPRFLLEHPVKTIQNGYFMKVPFITGVTTDEFGSRAFNILGNETQLRELNDNFDKFAPICFQYERDTENSKVISKSLKSFYFNDKPIDKSSLTPLAQLYADALTGFSVNRAAKLIAEKSNESVYYYKFSYQGRYSHFYTPNSNNTAPYGVVHHDDLIYLFYIPKLFPLFKETSPVEVEMVVKLGSLWANFARTGNPIPEPVDKLDNVKWEPFNLKTQKYMDIGNKLVMGEKLYDKRYTEWDKLFPINQYMKNKVPSG